MPAPEGRVQAKPHHSSRQRRHRYRLVVVVATTKTDLRQVVHTTAAEAERMITPLLVVEANEDKVFLAGQGDIDDKA